MTLFQIILAGGPSDHSNVFRESQEKAVTSLKFTPAVMFFPTLDQPGVYHG